MDDRALEFASGLSQYRRRRVELRLALVRSLDGVLGSDE